eukprot:CAMPEP_0198359744 /NCGR_PEP_ID=MMETSP1450-20131203/135729_1 /TAXON_ID=753684 ORGANISM="Madagascaria erythrocladiodes, Strain CCMP3234" /NCGR_SAMPLE_ID=MMETSP1450 /ASSEMBLY_ACC=CAM_ASM_001115 /LENGTH=87 /DNA_ID=CAMNT_0044066653 /DNA_START=57 /DNA_END=316 /DNA_ORIENTATION=-
MPVVRVAFEVAAAPTAFGDVLEVRGDAAPQLTWHGGLPLCYHEHRRLWVSGDVLEFDVPACGLVSFEYKHVVVRGGDGGGARCWEFG